MLVEGIVSQGYRIASGLNKEGVPGPNGEILTDSFVRQRPFFEKEIPELKNVWTGTINIDIAPRICRMTKLDHEVTCEWHPGITEIFGIVEDVAITYRGKRYEPAFIYYPLPSKIHTPRDSVIEVLAPKIDGLAYGDEISIEVSPEKLTIA